MHASYIYIYIHTGVRHTESNSAHFGLGKTHRFFIVLLTGFKLESLMSYNLESDTLPIEPLHHQTDLYIKQLVCKHEPHRTKHRQINVTFSVNINTFSSTTDRDRKGQYLRVLFVCLVSCLCHCYYCRESNTLFRPSNRATQTQDSLLHLGHWSIHKQEMGTHMYTIQSNTFASTIMIVIK